MQIERFTFSSYDGLDLPATLWLPDGEPTAILQITHGMTEHIERFASLAQELTEKGIAVAGFDLRGHGRNSGDTVVASLGAGGWDLSIEDMHVFFAELEIRFPNAPHYMLGFSLGSFLLREYFECHPETVAGAIIMGTGHQPALILSAMAGIIQTQIKKAGFNTTTKLVKKLSFGTYNQKFKPNRTEADWLCSDDEQIDLYLADSMCRRDISSGLFWEMLQAMKRTGSKDAYLHWNKRMPVLLLSGKDDPVGNFGKGVQAIKTHMEHGGLKQVTMHLLPNARHDVLHEEKSGAASAARTIIADWILSNQA